MTADAPREPAARKRDALKRLSEDKDLWVSTAGTDGPRLVPLSFFWTGERLLVATVATNPAGRNIDSEGAAHVALGHTRDVVLVHCAARSMDDDEAAASTDVDGYVEKCGWDPRTETQNYRFFELTPTRVESWKELNEHADRLLMEDRRWLV